MGRPNAELGGPLGVYTVTDGNNGVEVVVFYLLFLGFLFNGPVGSGMFQNGNNHFLV
jgi:hypothetical protein